MTTKDPVNNTERQLLKNNHDKAAASRNPERVKHAIKITLPTSHVKKAEKSSRDVHKYKGEGELDLNKYPHEIIERKVI